MWYIEPRYLICIPELDNAWNGAHTAWAVFTN